MIKNMFTWHYFHYYIDVVARDGVSSHQRLDCLLDRLFSCRSKETSKLHVTGLCEGNPPVTGGFPSQRACNAENVSIWWRHHVSERRRPPLNHGIVATNFTWEMPIDSYVFTFQELFTLLAYFGVYICIYIYNVYTYQIYPVRFPPIPIRPPS